MSGWTMAVLLRITSIGEKSTSPMRLAPLVATHDVSEPILVLVDPLPANGQSGSCGDMGRRDHPNRSGVHDGVSLVRLLGPEHAPPHEALVHCICQPRLDPTDGDVARFPGV